MLTVYIFFMWMASGDAGASRPRPSPKSLRLSGLSFGGIRQGWRARLAEGEPGLQGSRRTEGAPRRGTCEAPPIRHGTAVTPSPPGKDSLLRALGRDSPTVAPLRPCLRAPPWGQEAATSCGGRRRLLRLLRPYTVAKNRTLSALSVHLHYPNPARPTIPRAARAAHRCRPVASGLQTQHLKAFQAAPARKELASPSKRLLPQAKRRGVRGQPWCWLGLAAPGRPLVLSREWERTASHARAAGKSPSRHQVQPKAHHSARNEGGPLVPPGRQRTTDITPKAVPSRPREEAISLAHHEVPPSSQAARGPGAAMVLSRIGCPRAPFGSFPRVGKNASHIRGCAKKPYTVRCNQRLTIPRATGKEPTPYRREKTARRAKEPRALRAHPSPGRESSPAMPIHASVEQSYSFIR